jgi:energy-converting hydrogenase Eha subunit B
MARTTFSGPVKSDNGFEGAIVGNVVGNVTGNVAGNVTGNVTGSVDASGGTLRIASALVGALPAATTAGRLLYVTDANSGDGTVCFSNGSAWIDIKTGAAVIA